MRKKFIISLIIILTSLQGIYIFFPLPEIWPFSSYPMFSNKYISKDVSVIEIMGTTKYGDKIPLDIAVYFSPFNRTKLRKGIRNILHNDDKIQGKKKSLSIVFQYLLEIYNKNRNIEYHDGPEIESLSLYIKVWDWSNKPINSVKPRTFFVYSTSKNKH